MLSPVFIKHSSAKNVSRIEYTVSKKCWLFVRMFLNYSGSFVNEFLFSWSKLFLKWSDLHFSDALEILTTYLRSISQVLKPHLSSNNGILKLSHQSHLESCNDYLTDHISITLRCFNYALVRICIFSFFWAKRAFEGENQFRFVNYFMVLSRVNSCSYFLRYIYVE